MSCTPLINGILKDCSINIGGVQKVYISDFESVAGMTAADGLVSSITMSGTASYYEFQFNRNTSSLEETFTINQENGSTFVTQTVNLIIAKRDVAKRNTIALLTSGQKYLSVIVLDQNGTYWLVGKQNGAMVAELTTGTGTAKADANAYTITITAEEPEQCYEVDASVIPTII